MVKPPRQRYHNDDMTINRQGRPAKPAEAAQDLLSLSVGSLPGPEELRREIAEAFAAQD